MKLTNGRTVSNEFFTKYNSNKLSKKVYIEHYNRTFTFTIDLGDDHTYMVYCEETSHLIESDKWSHIKDLQKNVWWDIGWNKEFDCPIDEVDCDEDGNYFKIKKV